MVKKKKKKKKKSHWLCQGCPWVDMDYGIPTYEDRVAFDATTRMPPKSVACGGLANPQVQISAQSLRGEALLSMSATSGHRIVIRGGGGQGGQGVCVCVCVRMCICYQGQRLTITDDRREHWWQAENADGDTGFIPSNYVRKIGIESEVWFYPDLSRQRADNLLRDDGKEGCFLVRNSSKGGMYTLSLLHGDVVRHYYIRQDDKNFYYIADRHHFETIPELVDYHSHNGAGLITRLRRPPRQDNPQEPPVRDKWEIDPEDLEFGEELGSGQFGRVLQGVYNGNINVAIKMMKEGTMDEDDFIEEAKVMK